jgi:hypothetical protein
LNELQLIQPKTEWGLRPVRMARKDDTPYPALAALVGTITRGASTRQVQNRTKLSHSTAAALQKGLRVSPNTLYMFALGYGVPLNPLRVAMGLTPLAADPTARPVDASSGAVVAQVAEESPGYGPVVRVGDVIRQGDEVTLSEGTRVRLDFAGSSDEPVVVTEELLLIWRAVARSIAERDALKDS